MITIFFEDFTGVSTGELPANWTRNSGAWGVENSNAAGGIAPEMLFLWAPPQDMVHKITSPTIDIVGFSDTQLSFKHSLINDTNVPIPFDLEVKISEDGGGTWDSVWKVSNNGLDDIAPEIVTIPLSPTYDDKSISIALIFEGDNFSIWYWAIDDIKVEGIPN